MLPAMVHLLLGVQVSVLSCVACFGAPIVGCTSVCVVMCCVLWCTYCWVYKCLCCHVLPAMVHLLLDV